MSTGPGRVEKELEIEPADRPALEMARVPRFQETVYYIRDLIAQLEHGAESKLGDTRPKDPPGPSSASAFGFRVPL
jgi:hypothetical protein